MPRPICVACQRFYHPEQNDIVWEQRASLPSDDPRAPIGSHPAKLWAADLWKCDGCDNEIIIGHGAYPLAVHMRDRNHYVSIETSVPPTVRITS